MTQLERGSVPYRYRAEGHSDLRLELPSSKFSRADSFQRFEGVNLNSLSNHIRHRGWFSKSLCGELFITEERVVEEKGMCSNIRKRAGNSKEN